MPSFRNVRPCTFLGYKFAGANSLLYGTTDVLVAVEQCTSVYTVQQRVCGANSLLLNFSDIPVRSEKPFTISFFENSLSGSFCAAKTSLLSRTTDIRVRSAEPFTVSFFENSLSGSVHPCTLPDASFCAAKTSLLIRTTDVLVGSEKPFTVSFFANRQDRYEARAQINRRRIYDTLRINLCAATK